MTNKNDPKYDPDFPYAVTFGEYVAARFPADESGRANAIHYAQESVGQFVDTTPKPKIPAGAKHITWGIQEVAYSKHLDGLWYGWNHGRGLTEAELLDLIDDDEVVVLIPKEDA